MDVKQREASIFGKEAYSPLIFLGVFVCSISISKIPVGTELQAKPIHVHFSRKLCSRKASGMLRHRCFYPGSTSVLQNQKQ